MQISFKNIYIPVSLSLYGFYNRSIVIFLPYVPQVVQEVLQLAALANYQRIHVLMNQY